MRDLAFYVSVVNLAAQWVANPMVAGNPTLKKYVRRAPRSAQRDREFWLGEILGDIERDAANDLGPADRARLARSIDRLVVR